MGQIVAGVVLLLVAAAWCARDVNRAPPLAVALIIALTGELLMRATVLPEGGAWLAFGGLG